MGGECVAPHVGDVAPTYDTSVAGVGDVAPTYDTSVGRPHAADGSSSSGNARASGT